MNGTTHTAHPIRVPYPGMTLATIRPITWITIAVNIAGAWLIWTGSGTTPTCTAGDSACYAGESYGIQLGMAALIFALLLVDVVLGIVWIATRRRAA